jgi:hypothetical protein
MDAGELPYGANIAPDLKCKQRRVMGGNVMGGKTLDTTLVGDTEAATLAWLASALEQARRAEHKRLVGYLEEVLDDVVSQMESAARERPRSFQLGRLSGT